MKLRIRVKQSDLKDQRHEVARVDFYNERVYIYKTDTVLKTVDEKPFGLLEVEFEPATDRADTNGNDIYAGDVVAVYQYPWWDKNAKVLVQERLKVVYSVEHFAYNLAQFVDDGEYKYEFVIVR